MGTAIDVAPAASGSNDAPSLVNVLPALCTENGTLWRTTEETQCLTRPPRPSASPRPSTSAGRSSSEALIVEIEASPVESYHVRGMSDQMPFVTAKPMSELATRSSSTRARPKTSHGSPTPPYSSVPFAPYRQESTFVASPMPMGSVQRVEQQEGWSGEWNQDRMQDVIQKLRELR